MPELADTGTSRTDDVWGAFDTTPGAIESALRRLLRHRHEETASYVPARVINLVVVCDREWRGEIENRLDRISQYHPSRTILCAVETGRTTLDAIATVSGDDIPGPSGFVLGRERVAIACGEHHLEHLDSIVDPLLVPDLATVVWSPHGHPEAVDSLLHIAQVVMLDSLDDPDVPVALRRASQLAQRARVVDLSWLRSTPWRERVASAFDPPDRREELHTIEAVTVRHRPDSAAAGLMLLGWLSSRLGWKPSQMVARAGIHTGTAHGRRQEVRLTVEPAPEQGVPGLASIQVDTAYGSGIRLERGDGGLTERRRHRDGTETEWTVLGSSRGEGGILGEGIRQALLRDRTYGPALAAATHMTT